MIEYTFDVGENISLVCNVMTDTHPSFLLPEVYTWMTNNIPGAIFNGITELSPLDEGLSFSFMSEEDMLAFKLTWS